MSPSETEATIEPSDSAVTGSQDDYLAQVMAEIDEEVRRRRSDLPARVERELDELFLEHSPVAGRGGDMVDALRMVDAAAFIDPVVPVASNRSGGAVVKKSLRSLNLWYMGYITHQVSQFATAVSRALRLADERMNELQRQIPSVVAPPILATGTDGSWWTPSAIEALGPIQGRVLHAACGDGWLVRSLGAKGIDAYGVDPRPGVIDKAELDGSDLRFDAVIEHFRAVEPSALGGVVLEGVVDGMTGGQREELLDLVLDRMAPEAVLVVHSISPTGWMASDAPPEADLAPGRPLRPSTWTHLLAQLTVEVHLGPQEADYLVIARR